MIVAPGPSAFLIPSDVFRTHWTIGCNRAVKFCDPDFAVCVEPYVDSVWKDMRNSKAMAVFSHLEPRNVKGHWRPHPRMVRFPQGVAKHPDCTMSPYKAAVLAGMLGFEQIGVLGVDLTPDRYPDVAKINEAWCKLEQGLARAGQSLVNLNPESRLTITRGELASFRGKAAPWGSVKHHVES